MDNTSLATLLGVPRQDLIAFYPSSHFESVFWRQPRKRRGLVLAFDDRPRAGTTGRVSCAGPAGFDKRILRRAGKMARHRMIWTDDEFTSSRCEFVRCCYRACTVALVMLTNPLHSIFWKNVLLRWHRKDAIGWAIGKVYSSFDEVEVRHAA